MEEIVVSKLTLLNHSFDARIIRRRSRRCHGAIIVFQYAVLVTTRSALENIKERAITMTKINNCSYDESLKASMSVMKEESTTWIQLYSLFIDKTNRLSSNVDAGAMQYYKYTEHLTIASSSFENISQVRNSKSPRNILYS